MLAAAHRIRGFVRDTALYDRPYASLLLSKAYVAPSSGWFVRLSGLELRVIAQR